LLKILKKSLIVVFVYCVRLIDCSILNCHVFAYLEIVVVSGRLA